MGSSPNPTKRERERERDHMASFSSILLHSIPILDSAYPSCSHMPMSLFALHVVG